MAQKCGNTSVKNSSTITKEPKSGCSPKVYHFISKTGRLLDICFAYCNECSEPDNFEHSLWMNSGKYTHYTAFCNHPEPDSIDCWEPLTSGVKTDKTLTAQEKKDFQSSIINQLGAEGFTTRSK